MKKLAIFLALLTPSLVEASGVDGIRRCTNMPILLDNNDLSTTRTFSVTKLDGYDHLKFDVQFTHAATGTLTFTCTHKSAIPSDIPAGLITRADVAPTTCSLSAGTCTLSFAGVWVTPSLTADKDFAIDVGILNVEQIDCSVVHSAGTASDYVTVTGRKCVR